MSKFKVIETPIKGLLIIEPTTNSDKQGFSIDAESKKDLLEIGIELEFVQENSFKARRGVVSGMHFQRKQIQGRLVRVTSGAVLDLAIDLRPDSKTYGASWAVRLSAENQRMFWLPEQFAHGFLSLENGTEIVLKCTDYEDQGSATGIMWNDPIVNIDWQFERYDIDEKYLIISDRDKRLPSYRYWRPVEIWADEEKSRRLIPED